MNPYEIEIATTFFTDCPSCGCEFEYSDVTDLFEEIEVVKEYSGYNELVDGYTEWEQVTYFVYQSEDDHDCGCSCYFTCDDEPEDVISNNSRAAETTPLYGCGKCGRNWVSLANAKGCCVEEDVTSATLIERLVGKN